MRPSSIITTFISVSAAESSTYSKSQTACSSTIPTEIAETKPLIGLVFNVPLSIKPLIASHNATAAPVIDAVRVPPSA